MGIYLGRRLHYNCKADLSSMPRPRQFDDANAGHGLDDHARLEGSEARPVSLGSSCPQGSPPASRETIDSFLQMSRIDDLRLEIARLLDLWRAADEDRRLPILIRIRSRQDAIDLLRHRSPSLFFVRGPLDWIDAWEPDRDVTRVVAGGSLGAQPGLPAVLTDEERRSADRAICFLIAHIRCGDSGPVRCTIRDMSSTGAQLELASVATAQTAATDLPRSFRLVSFSRAARSEVWCNVVWRNGRRIGVRFDGDADQWPRIAEHRPDRT